VINLTTSLSSFNTSQVTSVWLWFLFLVTVLLNTAKCWNSLSFLKCVEEGTKIGHVVDLLHSKLDLNRCRWV